jgi:V8-like Glu-specific endopeptidase
LLADDLSNDDEMVVATREGIEFTGTLSEIQHFLKTDDLSKGQKIAFHPKLKLEDSVEFLFGRDERHQTNPAKYPFTAMGRLQLGCTGTFISSHVVLTAAHCVYEDGKYFEELQFYRRKDCGVDEYGSKHSRWSHVYTSKKWRNSENYDYDIAWIVYDTPSPVFMRYTSHMPAKYTDIYIYGYPSDKGPERCLWGSSDPLLKIKKKVLCYKVDTAGGQSGSAIFYYKKTPGRRRTAVIIGVHSSGLPGKYNEGVRMTRKNKDKSKKIINMHH